MKPWRVLWLIVVFTVSLTSAAVAGEPSGFRYDGTGVFPGCKPVTTWNEYEYKTVREGRSRRDVVTADKPVNIAWKTELPFWGNGQPVLVGGKLYLLREMRFWDSNELGPSLVCIDADSGKVEWSREVRHLDLIPQDAREKIVAAWVEDRQYIARKWQLAWRMHQANPDDKQELAKIWAEMKAMGFSNKKLSGQEGQKVSDHHMGDTGRFWGGDPKARQQIRNRLEQYNLWYPSWSEPSPSCPGRWMGLTFATPVSDGEHLYLRTAHHLLACYDLEGNCKWKTLFSRKRGYTCYGPSPVLVGDTIIVYTPGSRDRDDVLCRGFDKKTGKLLWETPGRCPIYAIGTPVHLNLDGTDVVFLAGGRVLRVRDGKVLAEGIGWAGAADNPVAHGDVVYLRNAQDGGGYGGKSRGVEEGIMAVRLKLTGPDKVTPEVLWSTGRTSEGSFGRGIVYHDGLVFATTRKAVAVLDANTGKVLKTTGARTGAWNLTVAGGYVFSGDDNKAEISVLTADRQLRHVATNRVGQEIKKPDDQWHYRNEKGEWGVAGTPMPLYFDDDKVYLRTWFHLYCFQASE